MARFLGATAFSADPLPGEAFRLLNLTAEPHVEVAFRGKNFEASSSEAGAERRVFPPAAAAALAARGLVRLERRGGKCLLALTDAGRRWLRPDEPAASIDPERAKHLALEAAVIDGPSGPEAVWRNAAEAPLDWLARRGGTGAEPLISPAQHQAGNRLKTDFHSAQMSPRLGADWSPTAAIRSKAGPAGAHISERVVAARQRVRKAMRAAGPELSGLLIDLCCFNKGLELIEAERRWPKRSAKLVARIALAALARHYGIEPEARGPDQPGQIRRWAAAPRGELFPAL